MEKLYEQLIQPLQTNLSAQPIAQEAISFYKNNEALAVSMFGYPSNPVKLSPLTQYLLLLHYNSPFSNNCGDIEERGNYAMDTKEIEKRIVRLYADKFGMGETPWGYVTSGGSESNSCGVEIAFTKYPNGVLYYSQAAHYSVAKAAKRYAHVEIPANEFDEMNLAVLFEQIEKNFQKNNAPANVILTHGTTKYGTCDDVDAIVEFLTKRNIPHYIHVDAALFGGIPNNQTNAPLITNAKDRGIDSVCVSMHKYVGFPDVHSVFVATAKPNGQTVAYIGQHDTTVSGSRSIPAYALYHHILEQENKQSADSYEKNILFFASLLASKKIAYYRAPLSNIFVIDKPSDEVCTAFQLSCFQRLQSDTENNKAHIIIFPQHTKEAMEKLVTALSKK